VMGVFAKKGLRAPGGSWSLLGAVFEDGTAMAWGESTSCMAMAGKHGEIVEIL
jgi:hypothetical protein